MADGVLGGLWRDLHFHGVRQQEALHGDGPHWPSSVSCPARSTPSATTSSPKPWHSAITERAMAAERGFLSMPSISVRSSFTRVMGSCASEASEE